MRRRMMFLLLAACALCTGIVAQSQQVGSGARVHQHLEDTVHAACDHAGDVFCTHLPIVVIGTGGQGFVGKECIGCTLTVIDRDGAMNHLDDVPAIRTDMRANRRGNSSIRFDKSQFRLNLVGEAGEARALEMMGMPAEANWVLNGPYMDKTLIRNYLMYNLCGEIMAEWTPRVRFCEVFITEDDVVDAEDFQGLYLMIEAVTVGPERVRMDTSVDSARETSFVICRQTPREENILAESFGDYTNYCDHELDITYPPDARLTDDQQDYITREVSEMERMLYSLDYDHEAQGYAAHLDVSSFVDYFILNEFSVNRDAGFVSTYAHRSIRGMLTMGPVWDFNNCFDNYIKASNMEDFHMALSPWFSMLLKDEIFVAKVVARYRTLREGPLAEDALLAYIDETVAYLGPAVERNYALWGDIFGVAMSQSPDGNPRDHAEAVDILKEKITLRGRWLDEHIELLYQFCAESKVKPYN